MVVHFDDAAPAHAAVMRSRRLIGFASLAVLLEGYAVEEVAHHHLMVSAGSMQTVATVTDPSLLQ